MNEDGGRNPAAVFVFNASVKADRRPPGRDAGVAILGPGLDLVKDKKERTRGPAKAADAKADPKPDAKAETKADARAETRAETRAEARAAAGEETADLA